MIARPGGIRQSLLFYYFSDKNALGDFIFDEFCEQHDFLLCKELSRRNFKISVTSKRCLFVASYFRLCLENMPLARFIAAAHDGTLQINSAFVKERYRLIIEDNPLALEKSTVELIMLENIGINSLLVLSFVNGLLTTPKEDRIRFKIRVLLRSLYVDDRRLEPMVDEIMSLEAKIRFKMDDTFYVTVSD